MEYQRVLASDKRRIGRGILAIILLVGGMFALTLGAVQLAFRIDAALGLSGYTASIHVAAMLPIALLIPWSMLIQRWLYGVRAASLTSVLNVFRTAIFGRAMLVVLPLWAINLVVSNLVMGSTSTTWSTIGLASVLLATLLLTPLQAAGEEYGYRGLVFRVAASWAKGPRTALLLGIAVSSVVFAVVHFSTDPWVNLYYLVFASTLAIITWRSGGLEIGIVIHAVNNTIGFLMLLVLHADFTAANDRSDGVGSAIMLLPCLLHVAITALVWWKTRDSGPVLTPRPRPRTHTF
ncbi:CPBP family intramembrane glutamic endopeptidase [Microbacterium azadirachtae]|uniref:CAAX protease self-immunity n=1 Tax=Microbacterium azadirachtae TaxID=582680 RepID=A0A1I6G597_9MICO|nr:CPBP family intramembrane glutamic endopeptidase [Microbacterium azadirachtae]SDL34489.1 CAAX protease self-immunity [Microbacterium azadirachtae]SEF64988.1 CAAX protease self-immunity [Microbacterium azadirachtae]SEF65844.1 CAAX protease self-immunity [Microbacterium azadirachtae]SFR37311.1 CAAX protease self-immunity [Microbacterium azadirachtae]